MKIEKQNPGFAKRVKSWLTGKYVENGNTASQNIPAGKWVTWKGQVYKAKTAITAGDTLSSSNLATDEEGTLNGVELLETELEITSSVTVAGHNAIYLNLQTLQGYHPISVYLKFAAGYGALLPLNPYYETSESRWACRIWNVSSSSVSSGTGKVGIIWKKD